MSQIKQITSTLKQLLKQNKVTYRMIAQELDMSEANIKRVFATNNFSLERLEQICRVINLTLSDLFSLSEKQQQQLTELTLQQEHELIDNPKVKNRGIAGDTSWGLLRRLKGITDSEPKAIFLMIGVNDFLFTNNTEIIENYSKKAYTFIMYKPLIITFLKN